MKDLIQNVDTQYKHLRAIKLVTATHARCLCMFTFRVVTVVMGPVVNKRGDFWALNSPVLCKILGLYCMICASMSDDMYMGNIVDQVHTIGQQALSSCCECRHRPTAMPHAARCAYNRKAGRQRCGDKAWKNNSGLCVRGAWRGKKGEGNSMERWE